jgi:hypothetical protein
MTVEEAKLRWCPMLGAGMRRLPGQDASTRCLSDQCMAWRWEQEPNPQDPKGRWIDSEIDGRCGFADR